MLLFAFDAPAALWLSALALPVIALFLLKRRRKDVPVGSTLLWAELLRDKLARSPFRRPREWLSLVLLVLAIVASSFAAAGMRLGRPSGSSGVVLVIDVSASMATTEENGTRLELARQATRKAVRALGKGALAGVLLAGATPRVLCPPTADLGVLEALLDTVTPELGRGDLNAALDAAFQAGLRMTQETASSTEVIVLSDFAVPPSALSKTEVPLPLRLVQCGTPKANAGIIHAAVTGLEDRARIFAVAAANSAAGGERTIGLYLGDELLDVKELPLAPGGTRSATFEVPLETGATARYRLALEPPDALALDDEAFLGVARNRPPRVLHVGDADLFLERLPRAFPGLELSRVDAEEARDLDAAAPFDLAVVTVPLPAEVSLPAAVELHIGNVPPEVGFVARGSLDDPALLDWERKSPWLRDVGLENLLVVKATRLLLPEEGAEALVRVQGGVQLARTEVGQRSVFVWASALSDSNLALLPAFPLLLRNLLGGRIGHASGEIHRGDQPLRIEPGLGEILGNVHLEVRSPSGEQHSGELWSRESFVWPGRLELGFYEATGRSRDRAASTSVSVSRAIGVSLLSERETMDLPELPRPGEMSGAAVTATSVHDWSPEAPVWTWLVGIALLLLATEALLPRR